MTSRISCLLDAMEIQHLRSIFGGSVGPFVGVETGCTVWWGSDVSVGQATVGVGLTVGSGIVWERVVSGFCPEGSSIPHASRAGLAAQ